MMQISLDNLIPIVKKHKRDNRKIIFTNGCFDILHSGHVRYLEEAKRLGDVMIVGLNSDSSIRRLKGDKRPVNNQSERALVLSALRMVDYVVIFEEDTPYNLIEQIVPHVLVKGGDWDEDAIVGSDIVKSNGGTVISLSYYEGSSTTELIKRLKENDLD